MSTTTSPIADKPAAPTTPVKGAPCASASSPIAPGKENTTPISKAAEAAEPSIDAAKIEDAIVPKHLTNSSKPPILSQEILANAPWRQPDAFSEEDPVVIVSPAYVAADTIPTAPRLVPRYRERFALSEADWNSDSSSDSE